MAESTPPFLLSPKKRFLLDDARRKHHSSIVSGEQTIESLDIALAQYQLKLCRATTDSNGAAANMFKLKGAQEFIAEFLQLAMADEVGKVTPIPGQLDYKA